MGNKKKCIWLEEEFPNFKAITCDGEFQFHDYIKDSWCILFSHPSDFTPICTTELLKAAQLESEFSKRNVKMVALSCNDKSTHKEWIKDIQSFGKLDESCKFPFPIIDDSSREIANKLGMIDNSHKNSKSMPFKVRGVYIIGPDKKLKLFYMYPEQCGRNFNEILRVIDSLQLNFKHPHLATPADWEKGQKCMLQPFVTKEDQEKNFPNAKICKLPSGKEYLREISKPEKK